MRLHIHIKNKDGPPTTFGLTSTCSQTEWKISFQFKMAYGQQVESFGYCWDNNYTTLNNCYIYVLITRFKLNMI